MGSRPLCQEGSLNLSPAQDLYQLNIMEQKLDEFRTELMFKYKCPKSKLKIHLEGEIEKLSEL